MLRPVGTRCLRGDEAVQGEGMDGCIGIHHEQILVERRVDTNDVLDLVVDLELQGVHGSVEVDLAEDQQLRPLAWR